MTPAAAAPAEPAVPADLSMPPAPVSRPPAPLLGLAVYFSQDEAPIDGTVTATVRLANDGNADAHQVVLSGTLPLGLECPACGGFYDPPSRRLQWALPRLQAGQAITHTFAVPVRRDAGWEGGVALQLGARAVESSQAARDTAVLRVPYPLADGPATALLRPGQEGQLVSADGRLTVTFPAQAVGITLTAAYSPSREPVGEYLHPLRRFDVVVRDPSGQEVHEFSAPIQVVYRYTWAEALGVLPEELFLAHWDEERGTWTHLPAQVDAARHLLTGRTTRFSGSLAGYFDLPSDDYMPQLQGFQEIDLFSGAASYSYPIEVLPGRGGLAPQLALSYSSGGVDWPSHSWDPEEQAGWVGYGWSLDVGSISRQNVGGWSWTGTPTTCEQGDQYEADDEFSLVLNGASHELVQAADGAYHTTEETYWQIWPAEQQSYGPRVWYVRTGDGTKYTFGTPGQDPLLQMTCTGEGCDACTDGTPEPYKWLLTQVEDVHGNKMVYEYNLESPTTCGPLGEYTIYKAAYLARISYNYVGDAPRTKIEFELESRPTWDWYASFSKGRYPGKFEQHSRLYAIRVQMWAPRNGTWEWQVARKYVLNYNENGVYTYDDDVTDETDQPKSTLTSVQLYGEHEQGSLPATTFEYYPLGSIGLPQVGRNRLKAVHNGYGGSVTYVYREVTGFSYRNQVVSRTVADELAETQTAIWNYAYSEGLRNSPLITGTACQGVSGDAGTSRPLGASGPRARANTEFRGYAEVTVTGPDGSVQVHEFALNDGYKGKETRTRYRDGAGNLYREVLQDYRYLPVAMPDPPVGDSYTYVSPEIAFVYLQQSRDRTCDGDEGTCQERKTTYAYDAALQGGTQYGNLTTIQEYDDSGALYRTTRKRYVPNANAYPGVWLVDRVAAEEVWEGAPDDNPLHMASNTWYIYDENTLPTQPPTVGDLKRVQRLLHDHFDSGTDYWRTAETTAGYDAYGNKTESTVYTDYGMVSQPRGQWSGLARVTIPTQGRTTTIGYDSSGLGYNLYPEHVVYPLIGMTVLSETAIYSYTLGAVLSYHDVNSHATAYVYDSLGRVIKVAQPGNSLVAPTVWVQYLFFGETGQQRVEIHRREGYAAGSVWEERYFDGLGRLIQTHSRDVGDNYWDQEVRQSTAYDALGRAPCNSMG